MGILAPFADVVVHSSAGFIDGQVIARSYREEGISAGSLQLHGHCFLGHAVNNGAAFICGMGHCTSSLLTPSASSSSSIPGATATCYDSWKVKQCQRKSHKNKCHKRRVRQRCQTTCGLCMLVVGR